jgi:hypothetical protein
VVEKDVVAREQSAFWCSSLDMRRLRKTLDLHEGKHERGDDREEVCEYCSVVRRAVVGTNQHSMLGKDAQEG